MEQDSVTSTEGCLHCNGNATSKTTAFCTACGRQLKPLAEAQFACRAAEGSAETAWRAFGFSDAYASRRARAKSGTTRGNWFTKRDASEALSATCRIIERDFLPPTMEQARVIGVESVVEGVKWDFSTEQLKVLALARSGALRGQRRCLSDLRLPGRNVAPAPVVVTVKKSTAKRHTRKGGRRGRRPGRRTPRSGERIERDSSNTLPTGAGREQGQVGRDSQRFSEASGGMLLMKQSRWSSPHPSGAAPNVTPASPPYGTTKRRVRQLETQEQAIAIARGGVRYGGMVFHRKGIKLTEDSPRSMRPREAFRSPGVHVLCTRYISVGGKEVKRRSFVAVLSAKVRASPIEATVTTADLCVDLRRLDCESVLGQRQSGSHLCNGMVLEVRAIDLSSKPCDGSSRDKGDADAPSTTTNLVLPAERHDRSASTDGDDEERAAAVNVADDDSSVLGAARKGRHAETVAVRNRSPDFKSITPPVPALLLHAIHSEADNERRAETGGRCRQGIAAVFAEDLTHSEVDALVGPTLVWKNPFDEDTTVGELEVQWTACLHSLCRRLRIVVSEGDDQGLPDPPTTEAGEHLPGVRGDAEDETYSALVPLTMKRRMLDVLSTEGDLLPPNNNVAKDVVNRSAENSQSRSGVCCEGGRSSDSLCRREIRVSAMPSSANQNTTEASVRLDRRLARVGARVPWGRRQRGRFAKVLFTVSLGRGCRGLKFTAVSSSPTGDPLLRGRWECQATDCDLARFLSPRVGRVIGIEHRARSHTYDPNRCAAELQERRELKLASTVLAQRAFTLVLCVPGGVFLSFAGVAQPGRREVSWPQDIKEDKEVAKASIEVQRAWRGWASRKRTRWVRMEREGRRRLSRMRKDIEDERAFEEEERSRTKRRAQAQIVLAAAARGRGARKEASSRRAKRDERQRRHVRDAAEISATCVAGQTPDTQDSLSASEIPEKSPATAHDGTTSPNEASACTATPGFVRLERQVTIDGTEVQLTAHVCVDTVDGQEVKDMVLVAVDKKARRSSRLSLEGAEIESIVNGAAQGGENSQGGSSGDDGRSTRKAAGVFSAVVQALTVFNSRRKDLFILSYRGKKVVAPH